MPIVKAKPFDYQLDIDYIALLCIGMQRDFCTPGGFAEPPNLYRGEVQLEDGRVVLGILYPRELAEGKRGDISEYGKRRSYVGSKGVENRRESPGLANAR